MNLTPHVCHKSSLLLNEQARRLCGEPADFHIHYWGGKPRHLGNEAHAHIFYEICYVAEGEGEYMQSGVSYQLRPGTLYCSKPGARHRIQSKQGMLLLFVAFEMEATEPESELLKLFAKLNNPEPLFMADMADSPPVWLWKSLMLHAADAEDHMAPFVRQLAHSLLLSLLYHFSKHQSLLTVAPGEAGHELRMSASLRDAKDYVLANLSSKLTIGQVSQAVHLSERHLSRILSGELGLSFPSWIRLERIKKACYLLAFTDLSVTNIAREAGFDTIHYFNRVFNETLGLPPGAFRKQLRSHNLDTRMIHDYLRTAVRSLYR